MNQVSRGTASEQSQLPTTPRGSGWLGSLLLGFALVFVYLMNGRDMGTYDTIATTVLPLRILRGHGIYFDDERPGMRRSKLAHTGFVTISHGRLVSLYPIAPAVVAVPLFAPQVAVLDLCRPGWDRDRLMETVECLKMARRSMAVVVALAGVVLHRLLLALGGGPGGAAGCTGGLPGIGPLDGRKPGAMAARAGGAGAGHGDHALASPARWPLAAGGLGCMRGDTRRLPADGPRLRRGHRDVAGVDELAWTSLVRAGANPGRSGTARLQHLVLRLDPGWAGRDRAIAYESARNVGPVVG